MNSILSYTSLKTPLGLIFISSNDKGLSSLSWERPKNLPKDDSHEHLSLAKVELEEYFNGLRSDFSVALSPHGTDFQIKVWEELRRIPFGTTVSYKELAEGIERPKAHRAVGSANGKNPLPIIVPCHRVIASSGGLGGYSAGLEVKRKLLALEGLFVS